MNRQTLIDNLKREYSAFLLTHGVIEQPSKTELGVIDLYFEFPNGWITCYKIQQGHAEQELMDNVTRYYRSQAVDLTWIFEGADIKFNDKVFTNSYIYKMGVLQKLAYLSLATWGRLPLQRIFNSINPRIANHPNVKTSLTSNLDVGVKLGLFLKEGEGEGSFFSLSKNFANTDKFAQEKWFTPTSNAIKIARGRRRIN